LSNPQQSFVRPLLARYEANGRHQLPWLEPDRSSFEILVTEILLQRTTVAAVSWAYLPIIARYPSPEAVVADQERRLHVLSARQRERTIDAIGLEGWRIDVGYPEDRDEAEDRLSQDDSPSAGVAED